MQRSLQFAGDEGAIGNLESVIVGTFVKEVGLESDAEAAKAATFDAVLTALEAELVMPSTYVDAR